MKLNDIKEASYAGAMLTQLGKKLNPFDKSGESQMSTKDRMVQQQFVQDLVGRAAVNLSQGIQNGLIDPDPNAGSAPQPSAQPATSQMTSPAQQTVAPANNPVVSAAAQKRISSQKAAAATAQKQMAANPAPAKPAAAAGPAQVAAQTKQQKQAAATQALNKTAAPFSKVAPKPKVWKNNRKLGAAAGRSPTFESILDEAGQYQYTISSYLENMMKQYMKGIDTTALKPMIDAVQATYSQDKGKKALQKLAGSAYSLYWAGSARGSNQAAGAARPTNTNVSGATTAPTATATSPAAASATTPAKPQQVKSVYMQLKDLMKSLNKQQKGWVLNSLKKEIDNAAPIAPAASSGASSFSNIAGQLASRPTASSTGGTTTGVSGVVAHKAGRGTKLKQANSLKTKSSKKAPIGDLVTESKKYKVWGQK